MEAWPTKITRIQAQMWNETGAKPGARSSPGWREGGGPTLKCFLSSSPASASCGQSARAVSVTCTHHAQSAWLPHSGVLPAVFPEVITGH